MTKTELRLTAAQWLSADGRNTRESLLGDLDRDGVSVGGLADEMISSCCLDENEEDVLAAILWAFDHWTSS